jgi:hypothetical protein
VNTGLESVVGSFCGYRRLTLTLMIEAGTGGDKREGQKDRVRPLGSVSDLSGVLG